MEARWFYHDGQASIGPFTRSRLLELLGAGFIGPQTFVWREGDPGWVTLSSLMQFAAPAIPAAPPPISSAPDSAKLTRKTGSTWSDSPAETTTVWRRYGARMLDTTIHGLIGFIFFGFAWYAMAPISADEFFNFIVKPHALLVNMILSCLLAAIVGGFVVGGTGSSVGKAIFGIKVLNARNETIGIREGLLREIKVLVFGLGFGIPIVALVTMSVAFKRLKEKGATSWDKDRNVVLHRENNTMQRILTGIGLCLIVAIAILMKSVS